MTDFDQVYRIVEESSNECAFNKEECIALWELACSLPKGAMMFEIGIQYGRSTTVLGFAATEKDLEFIATDNWKEDVSSEARDHILNKMVLHKMRMHIWDYDSEWALKEFTKLYPEKKISLLHVDGNHDYEAVKQDCELWLPKVGLGGYVCFDDYGHDSLPGVYQAVSEYMKIHDKEWEFVGRFGNKLGIFMRVK